MKIRIENITKTFESKTSRVIALENVTCSVASGEFVCLVGPSGCGKSTLLNIVAGLDHADSGTVYCNDRAITDTSTDRIVMFQEAALFPWLDVVGNVEFGLQIGQVAASTRRARAERYLGMVHLARFARANVHELSGGMKQRVALARALALEPAALLMDEPFAALDAQTRDLLHGELQEIWSTTRKTILFVTHNVHEAVRLGDRVLVMSARPGHIKREFKTNLPRPREMEDHALVDLARQIAAELKDEVNRALAEEVNDVN